MRNFFILSHIGINNKFWNEKIQNNPLLISHFDANKYKYYINARIEFQKNEYETKQTRHFDILVFNWQTGFKDTLNFSKVIYFEQDYDKSIEYCSEKKLLHPMYIHDHFAERFRKINLILKTNIDNFKISVDENKSDEIISSICDFLRVPNINQGENFDRYWN
jgi:hypothetical protein